MTFLPRPRADEEAAEAWPGAAATAVMIAVFFIGLAAMFALEERRRLDDPVLKGQRGEITTLSPQSLVREEHFARALAAVGAAVPAGSRVQSLRLTPLELRATLAGPDGRQFDLTVDAGHELTERTGGGVRPTGPAPRAIDPALPLELVTRAEQRLRLQPRHLDYVLLSVVGDEPAWGLYYAEPPLDNDATAAFDGSDLRIIGTPPAAARQAAKRSGT